MQNHVPTALQVTLEQQIFAKGILLTRKIPMKLKIKLQRGSSIMLAFLDGIKHRWDEPGDNGKTDTFYLGRTDIMSSPAPNK
jgi:hypothetical protein